MVWRVEERDKNFAPTGDGSGFSDSLRSIDPQYRVVAVAGFELTLIFREISGTFMAAD